MFHLQETHRAKNWVEKKFEKVSKKKNYSFLAVFIRQFQVITFAVHVKSANLN